MEDQYVTHPESLITHQMEKGMFSSKFLAVDDINIHLQLSCLFDVMLSELCKFTPNMVEFPTISAPGILAV